MISGNKGRKPPALSKLVLPSSQPDGWLASNDREQLPASPRIQSSISAVSIDDGLEELERLRLNIDTNLKLRPLPSTSPSPSQYFTPSVAYFSESNQPLPISPSSLFSRMLCSPRPLLLDTRPPESFHAFRLKDSINIAIPSARDDIEAEFLDMSDIHRFIKSGSGKQKLNDLLRKGGWDGDAVVYDDERALMDDSPTWLLMEYLLPLVKGQVWYLEGGMSAASTLPHFQLVVVTASQTQGGSQETSLSIKPTPSRFRKRSAPNLRQLQTSSMEQLPSYATSEDPQILTIPPVPHLGAGPVTSLSSRRTNFPSRIELSSSTPATPRATSPLLTARAFTDESPESFQISTVLPHFLYLGPDLNQQDHVASLHALSVKRILNVAFECDDDQGLDLRGQFEKYHRIPLKDTVEEENVGQFLRDACDFLDDARLHDAATYVHCRAGKSRSVMAIIGYLIHSHYWTLSKAYAFVRERREGISPNIGFVSELMTFEEAELGGRSVGVSRPARQASGDRIYRNPAGYKRGLHIRESLPPLLSNIRTESDSLVGELHNTEGLMGQETEIRDASGRYKHQRRAPVDENTLQPLRRVSKAGLESTVVL